jgi:ribonuclease BN (tRNA processing enzyme)
VEPGQELEKPGYRVTVAEGEHCQPYLMPLAFRFDTPEGSLVYSGDTGECERIVDLARGVDLLIHDCSQPEERRVMMGYQKIHSSPEVVGRIAAQAGVKKVVALHFGVRSEPPEILSTFEAQIKRSFKGEVLIAKDLDQIEL